MRSKISVVGAGNVGASCALWLAERELGDVVLVDIPQTGTMPQGKALDLQQAGPIYGFNTRLAGATDYAATENSDVVVITAGFPRKPGMSREDLVSKNQDIITAVMAKIVEGSPQAIVVVVTNPLDTMVYLAHRLSGWPRARVFGQAGQLDSARMAAFIALELKVAVANVQASVMGGHGDEMVPLVRYTTVAGVPIGELLPAERVQAIVDRTRTGGGEIVNLLGTSAYYAPGAAAARMVEAILKDEKLILPCSVVLEGEYGLNDIAFGVPVKLGRTGVEQILEVKLDENEKAMLQKSVDMIRGTMSALQL
ncbi:MAG TPA: malate dehydrogenase [Anaerolineae bacterium]|nr:malate dehydrogenase [Anaerolineae bacterium]